MARRLLLHGCVKAFQSIERLAGTLAYHRERHAVLAGNLANVDTPGYRPVDLAPPRAGAADGGLAQTRAGHLAGPGGAAGVGADRIYEDAGEAGADGNAVELERELAKVDANRVRYQACAEVASRRFALLRYAAGDGR